MAIKIFLLGRPGSGKSTAARYSYLLSKRRGWSTYHINDYPFLLELFHKDTCHQQFRPSGCGGFDVLDFSVLDQALHVVEREANRYICQEKTLLLLEFARDDYWHALKQFHPHFLQDSYFLVLDADINTCVHRVYERSFHPTYHDDHFISEEMIRSYYQEDNGLHLPATLQAEYGISHTRVHIIDNTKSRAHFYTQIRTFLESYCYGHQMSAPTSFRNFSSQQAAQSVICHISSLPYEQRLVKQRPDAPCI